jgi:allophanate hydrolase
VTLPASLDLASLAAAYRQGLAPSDLVGALLERCRRHDDPAVWIHRVADADLEARAHELERIGPQGRPLYGAPFAIKDNIDVAGLPTTAACPAFAYTAGATATAVQRLLDAGAILLGKTNLDQFATGLVGTRSPYGACRNPFDPLYIAGGSSSGSAVAVAAGLVSFALGTDTAGSGRFLQSGRGQADPGPRQHARGRPGLPLPRLRVDLRALLRRRRCGIGGDRRLRCRRSVLAPRR